MQIHEHMKKLGLKVKDKVTGFEGVVTSISFDLYGCIQVVVTPPAEAGKQEDSRWYDVTRLTILSDKPVMDLPNYEYGYVAEGRKGPAAYRDVVSS
jgi:hypothetical protein